MIRYEGASAIVEAFRATTSPQLLGSRFKGLVRALKSACLEVRVEFKGLNVAATVIIPKCRESKPLPFTTLK